MPQTNAIPLVSERVQSPAVSAQPGFNTRLVVGLLGVLLATLAAGLNGSVADVAFADIRGAFAIGQDQGSWITTWYQATQVAVMAFAPWCAVTFSIRRFTLVAIMGMVVLAVLCPLAPNATSLLVLRALQGLMAGCLPPVLMTVALRFLPPQFKLYGLAGYALTATFGPNLGIPLAALWTDGLSWQFVFWQVVPLGIISYFAVGYGLPQDPLRLERFKQLNWLGLLSGFPAICALVIVLLQGDRLDWFHSVLITNLTIGGLFLLLVFFINESLHPLPFFSLSILRRRNFTHALITLAGALIVLSSTMIVPAHYLAAIHHYRPLQSVPMALLVALPQLLVLPLVAAVCNLRWVDCRWILALGMALCLLSCLQGMSIDTDWTRQNFYGLLALQIVGQPMVVIALLMSSTSVVSPQEGPVASAWFNTIKGLAAVIGTSLITTLSDVRSHFHLNVLLDQLGNQVQALTWAQQAHKANQHAMSLLSRQLIGQAHVLTVIDIFTVMAVLAAILIALIPIIPQRVFPPRVSIASPTANSR